MDYADDMIHWVDSKGADGFNLNIDVQPAGLDLIADEVIPVLQKRGRYRQAYAGGTLRDNLGLPRFDGGAQATEAPHNPLVVAA